MKKQLMALAAALLAGAACAAPGFVKAVFSGSSYNGTSDIWTSAKATVVDSLDEIYEVRSDIPENTTYAYGTYMLLEGGVEYYFDTQFDDHTSIKIDETVVLSPGSECERRWGVVKFADTAWHKVELRFSNNGGVGGNTGYTYGGLWFKKGASGTYQKFINDDAGSLYVTEAPEGYVAATPEYAFRYCTYSSGGTTSVRLIKSGEGAACVSFPDQVDGRPVTEIGGSFFYGNTTLKSIAHWPSQLTTIGMEAFRGCTALESVDVPETVTSLGDGAFIDCTALTAAKIPATITKLNSNLFNGCSSLVEVALPAGLKSIQGYAFSGCTALETVELPETLEYLGERVFQYCRSLKRIRIPDGVTFMGEAVLEYCDELETANIPAGITTLEAYMFQYDYKLKDIQIPDNVTEIKRNAFRRCTSLKSMALPDEVTAIPQSLFDGCTELETVTCSDNVLSIGANAFYDCVKLRNFAIPSHVTTINKGAFYNCKSMTGFDLPEGLTYIESYAFQGCVALKSVVIPSTVTVLGFRPWKSCSGLQYVEYKGALPKNFENSPFGCRVAFPKSSGAKWIAAFGVAGFHGFCESGVFTANVVSSSIRESDPTVLDVVYRVSSRKPTVKVRVLAFEDGERSFAKVVRPETFVADPDGNETAGNVGDAVTPNVEHTLSWRVSSDWQTKLAKVKFEVLACESELLPLELMTIPASDQYGKMKVSWNAIADSQWLDAMFWLYADKDSGLTLENGQLKTAADGRTVVDGTSVKQGGFLGYYYDENGSWIGYHQEFYASASEYVFGKMGYSLLTGDMLTYANAETRLGLTPSGARQYAYKIVEE